MLLPDNWKYYNHAVISALSPSEVPDLSPIMGGAIWNKPYDRSIMLARWTDCFDCNEETEWWYCIKDDVFDIGTLNAKKRYEINKGKKNFDIGIIDPMGRIDDLWNIQQKSFMAYPAKYRPKNTKEEFVNDILSWKDDIVFVAYLRETREICAYAMLTEHERWISFPVLKAKPEYEKLGVNAAVVAGICDGERNILHETAFQSYLERYFGFRKAYCRLHIAYRPYVGHIIRLSRKIPKLVQSMSFVSGFSKLSAILRMDAIVQSYNSDALEKRSDDT